MTNGDEASSVGRDICHLYAAIRSSCIRLRGDVRGGSSTSAEGADEAAATSHPRTRLTGRHGFPSRNCTVPSSEAIALTSVHVDVARNSSVARLTGNFVPTTQSHRISLLPAFPLPRAFS